MRDKDQKLLFETYQQLNEALGGRETANAIVNAWEKSGHDKEVFRKYIETIKDHVGEHIWRAASGQIFRMPEQELDVDMLEVIDSITDIEMSDVLAGYKPAAELDASEPGREAAQLDAKGDSDLLDLNPHNIVGDIVERLGARAPRAERDMMSHVVRALMHNNFKTNLENAPEVWYIEANGREARIEFQIDGHERFLLCILEHNFGSSGDTMTSTYHIDNQNHVKSLVNNIRDISGSISEEPDKQ